MTIQDHNLISSKEKEKRLREVIRSYRRVLVAYSGGVDSSVVAKISTEELGQKNALIVLANSPSLSRASFKSAIRLARSLTPSFNLKLIRTQELKNKSYQRNSASRCYFCKQELYRHLNILKDKHRIEVILNGENTNDQKDHRPGATAAKMADVKSPLQIAGFGKLDIRKLAKKIDLPNHQQTAEACLASRVAYHYPIGANLLKQIEQVEVHLKRFGFNPVRCRYHQEIARLEISPHQFHLALDKKSEIISIVQQAGFVYATLDLQGFNSGSLNKMLKLSQQKN